MKRTFKAIPDKGVVATTTIASASGFRSTKLQNLLKGLTEDMLQQVWENYPESDEDEAYELVLDHVILVITEMDDGEDPVYSDLLPFADYDNAEFCKSVKRIVHRSYDDYEWYV